MEQKREFRVSARFGTFRIRPKTGDYVAREHTVTIFSRVRIFVFYENECQTFRVY